MGWWILLALVVLFLVSASFQLRGRNGADVTSERHRTTGGYGAGNG